MKIISIEIVNSRAIRCFKLQLNGENLEIAGDPGTGKTTAVSALWDIIKKRADSLSHGQRKGHVIVRLGEGKKGIIATRTHTKAGSQITLKDERGAPIDVSDFRRMISELSVNPHKILSMRPKEQAETLLAAADLGGFNLEDAEIEIAGLEEQRLDAHRAVAALAPGDPPQKTSAISVTELAQKLEQAQEVNRQNDRARDKGERLAQAAAGERASLETVDQEIKNIQTQISQMQKRLKAQRTNRDEKASILKGTKEALKIHQDTIDKLEDAETASIQKAIFEAEATNRAANAWANWVEKDRGHQAAENRHAELADQVRDLRQRKADALNGAKWPLDGLEIDGGDVVYKGALLENLGSSEQMLVTAALAVADIKAHPLKVVRMDGVESMSIDDFKALTKLFNGQGIQVLSTRVSRDDVSETEIVIEEGVYSNVTES